MSALFLLAIVLPAWPAGPLTEAQAKRVDAGDLISERRIEEGIMHGRIGGTIERDAAWVEAQLRETCFTVGPPQMIDSRLLSIETMESRGGPEQLSLLKRDDIEALKTTPCSSLRKATRFYSYAVFDSPGFFPDAWTLVRYELERKPDGGLLLITRQVAGSTKDAKSKVAIHPLGPDRAVMTTEVTFELGIPMPDAMLRMIIDVDEEAPRATQLRALRSRAAGD